MGWVVSLGDTIRRAVVAAEISLYEGKEKLLALAHTPKSGLADARQRRDDARRHLAHGIESGSLTQAQPTGTDGSDRNL